MAHNTDWKRFDYPWNILGPRLQLALRKDIKAIVNGQITKQERERVRRPYHKKVTKAYESTISGE